MKRLPLPVPAMMLAVAAMSLSLLVLAACQGRSAPQSVPSAEVEPVEAVSAIAATPVPPTPEPTATATPEPTATATATPEPTATPTPTPTPAPLARQLTSGGCCTQPFWSADSRQVRFIDKPAPDAPVGIWGVVVDQPLAEPELVSRRLEDSTALPDFVIETTGNTTAIERVADGERWTVPAGGRSVSFSPGRTAIAWTVSDDNVPFERRVSQIWVADLDGSNARQVITLPRGGLSGWIDEETLLVSGWESSQGREQIMSALSLADGSATELFRAQRIRGQSLSPDGRWLAFYVTFDGDANKNGAWVVRTDGSEQRPLDAELFGAYQWRGCVDPCERQGNRLLVVPFRPAATYHELWELNADTGEVRQLVDPAHTPFKIANGDWRVSPDGRFVAYVETSDRNIWVLDLSP